MEVVAKLCILALVAGLCAVLLKENSGPSAMLLSLAACMVLISIAAPQLAAVFSYCKQLAEACGIKGEIFVPVCKVLVICLSARITAEICRDAGERALASGLEMAGAAAGIVVALPLVQQALKLIAVL